MIPTYKDNSLNAEPQIVTLVVAPEAFYMKLTLLPSSSETQC